jgi:hypothetical protein
MKHRFPEKRAPQSHPIKPPSQLAFLPGFDRVSVPEPVQVRINPDQFFADPTGSGITPWNVLTEPHDGFERRINANLESLLTDDLPKRPRTVKLIQW